MDVFERIKEIRDRRNKITHGNWMVCLGSGYHVCTGIFAEDPITGKSLFIADFLSEEILDIVEKNYDHRDNMNFVANAPKDIEYLLAALQDSQTIMTIAREELTQNCMFFASGEYKSCPREEKCKCHMKRTCEALLQEDRQ